jgi:hypothetical protein
MKPSYDPRTREKLRPQISANALAKFLVSGLAVQETILRDARFPRQVIVTPYQDVEREIASYLADPRRDKRSIDTVKEKLRQLVRSDDSEPGAINNAKLGLALMERFEVVENSLGLRSYGFEQPGRTSPLRIHGVVVPVHIDLIIQPLVVHGEKRVGGILFRSSKDPDTISPKKEETRLRRTEIRRDMGRYVATMIALLLEAQFPDKGAASLAHSFAVDLHLGESIPAGSDGRSRKNDIDAACRMITRLWDTIEPPPEKP